MPNLFIITVILITFFLTLNFSTHIDSPINRNLSINGERLTVPNDWNNYRISEIKRSENQVYMQLWFTLDPINFNNVPPDYRNGDVIDIEIRPIRSEFGETHFWTEHDRINISRQKRCEEISISEENFLYCRHTSKIPLVNFTNGDSHSIYNKNETDYISVFG